MVLFLIFGSFIASYWHVWLILIGAWLFTRIAPTLLCGKVMIYYGFWMHFILCSCFPQLRRENYFSSLGKFDNQEIHEIPGLHLQATLSRSVHDHKVDTGVIDIERESVRDEEESEADDVPDRPVIEVAKDKKDIEQSIEQLEEAHDYTHIDATASTPLRPPRPSRVAVQRQDSAESQTELFGDDKQEEEEGTVDDGSKWHPKKIFTAVKKRVMPKRNKTENGTIDEERKEGEEEGKNKNNNGSDHSVEDEGSPEDEQGPSAFYRLYGKLRRRRTTSVDDPNALEVLRPDYTNRFDILDKKKRDQREKKDRKMLGHRIRKQLREAMKEDARIEKKRKKVTDAIELLLQLLRMMTSFAILVGNIRKTFIPAQFKYLKPGQHAYDNYELLLFFRATTFLDISMFWTNMIYVYCLQWQLLCRLGCKLFFFWATVLGLVSTFVMFIPMTTIMNDLDLSWCRLMPNTTFARFQPNW
ncbi:unnamed protein product [Caenorhabditis auriculariae]|uniref:Uncharacterized protein n=1 Tax=Caenorhabditis auriculariae TaxID=2777116 RepID=A0A8S1H111_9PELO|nr:unnamed protein product [Caenorhabditis auriculariae]